MSNEILTFKLTNDNRPLREQSLEGSILSEQYKYALRQINEYLGELDLENISKPDHEESPSHDRQNQRSETIGSDIDYNNNIFAFIGDRGSGKTSCMITVADFLIRKNEVLKAEEYPKIDKVNFVTIDLIDPAYFDSGHNLISLFLAKLYKSFCEVKAKYERDVRHHYDKGELSENTRNQFLYQFRRTQENLYHVMGIIKYDNNRDLLEFVDGLSASVNLKDNIKELIDLYLEYIGMKDAVLILRIDDVDLNEKHAGQMVEAMRKYFIQPNILVLLSLKLKQLEDVKYLELKEFYDKHDKGVFTRDELYEMVYKYMMKLIPRSHRIFMPKYDYYHGTRLFVEYYNLIKKDTDGHKKVKSIEFASVRQAVPQLIFWKTRYLFYNYIAHESYIVPENLRELRQLVKLMVTLPDYRENDAQAEEAQPNRNNKIIFKNYFFDTWLSNNLPSDYKSDALRLVNESNNRNINGLVKDILVRRYSAILSQNSYVNTSKLWSFADVISAILHIEKNNSKPEVSKFLFFIKSIYSIKLYEAYDEMTEDSQTDSPSDIEEIFLKDESTFNTQYSYQQLVGGALFKGFISNNPFTSLIEKGKLEEMIESCTTLKEQVSTANPAVKNSLLKKLTLQVQWMELLMLCVLDDDKSWSFELGCMFNRMPYMKTDDTLYKQLKGGESFFNDILRNKDRGFKTLYDEFIASAEEPKKYIKDEDHRWKSFCTIRNVEVLEGFIAFIRNGSYSKGDALLALKEYFTRGNDYEIKTYDRDESGKENYTIDFKFFKKVIDLIDATLADPDLKRTIVDILDVNPTTIQEVNQPVQEFPEKSE